MKRRLQFLGSGMLSGLMILSALVAVADERKSEEAIKPLIVMVKSNQEDGGEEVGAGIIFGQRGNSLYIVTANHVVRQGLHDAKNVRVQFRWLPGEEVDSKLLADSDREMDWAVLKVENVDQLGLPPDGLSFSQLGEVGSLQRGDRVFLIGNPTGHPWHINVTPDGVTGKTSNSIFF